MIETNVQVNEVIVLIIMFVGYVFLLITYKNRRPMYFMLAYSALLIGGILTIAEVFIYPQIMHYAEHVIGIMGAAILFFICAYLNNKRIVLIKMGIKNKEAVR